MKIYSGEVCNFQKALLWKQQEDLAQLSLLNKESVSATWGQRECIFFDPPDIFPEPDITMLIPGFAFRKTVQELAFPSTNSDVEFLNLDVEGASWVFVNSLRSTSAYDPIASKFMRSINGQIYFIFRLVVTDSSLKDSDVFTISDSNRAIPIFTERFVHRLEKSKVKRMNFKEIGEIV